VQKSAALPRAHTLVCVLALVQLTGNGNPPRKTPQLHSFVVLNLLQWISSIFFPHAWANMWRELCEHLSKLFLNGWFVEDLAIN